MILEIRLILQPELYTTLHCKRNPSLKNTSCIW